MNHVLSILVLTLAVVLSSGCLSPRLGRSDDGSVQQHVQRICREHSFPGMTVAWVSPGAQGFAATGLADVERGEPMRPTSRMLAASIGKSFVGALCVVLEQEERLSLDDPIARWLGDRPWFERLPNRESITLRHLLTHTAGLPDHVHTAAFAHALSTAWSDRQNRFSPDDLVAFVLDEPALFEAGQGWSYSDTGYILAGLVVEAATGEPLFPQITSRFLIPLGLNDTMPSDRRDLPGLAAGYPSPGTPFGFPNKSTDEAGHLRWHPGVEWAGGGLVSSAPDLARWGATLFGQTGLSGVSMKALLASVPMSDADPSRRYGLGVGVTAGGPHGPVYGHAGWIPGYVSSLRHYPDRDLTVAIQINTDIGIADAQRDVLGRIETQVLQAILGEDH